MAEACAKSRILIEANATGSCGAVTSEESHGPALRVEGSRSVVRKPFESDKAPEGWSLFGEGDADPAPGRAWEQDAGRSVPGPRPQLLARSFAKRSIRS